jgi:hypothetical protein
MVADNFAPPPNARFGQCFKIPAHEPNGVALEAASLYSFLANVGAAMAGNSMQIRGMEMANE